MSEDEVIKVYTEDDGTEIDEDTFSEVEQGSTFICAKGDETWLPRTV